MNKRIKARWIKALRSGKYKQGFASLRPTENTFCCLGVLCDLYSKEKGEPWDGLGSFFDEVTALPEEVYQWAGLLHGDPVIEGHWLSTYNDGLKKDDSYGEDVEPHSFKQIAALIRKHL